MPNTDVMLPIQLALYDLLTGDAQLSADITGVFDHVPESQAFPYVTIGDASSTSGGFATARGGLRSGAGSHDTYGARTTETIHVWSAYHGYSEALGIVDHLMRLLDHQPLTIDEFETVLVHHDQTVPMRDPDADLRHVAVRFAVETETAA